MQTRPTTASRLTRPAATPQRLTCTTNAMPLPLLEWLERTGLSASDTGPRPVLSCTLRQLAAALAAVGVGLAATGCAVTTNGSPAVAGHSGPLAAPPVAVAALDRLLLSTAEINAVMAATGMTVHTSRQNMWDDSPGVTDMNCLAVYGPAEDKIYTGRRGWTAMGAQVLQEPGDAWTHYVLQSVVAFPSVADATTFFTASSKSRRACSNRQFIYTRPDLTGCGPQRRSPMPPARWQSRWSWPASDIGPAMR